MRVRYQKFIYRDDIKLNPEKIYIFGDNTERVGFGGQAKEMRGEPNSFGIATKLAPSYNTADYMRDTPEHFDIVIKDFERLYTLLNKGSYAYGDGLIYTIKALVIPEDGIGTGIANLKDTAPLILKYINQMLFNDIPNKWSL